MVMQSEEEKEENDYLIRTPVDLFSLVERKDARGVEVLYQFLKECFALLKGAGSVEHMTVMVTMHEMKGIWADVIRTALLKLGIPSSAIFCRDIWRAFYTYLMNQKKELLTYHVALLEYERDCITAWHFWLERKTKPVLAKTEKCFRLYLDNKARKGRGDEEWGILRDSLLHKNLEKMFENTPFSAVYLVGREFEGEWMDKSFRFLCRKRRSFRGDNLYTMGACYAAMEENGVTACKDTLYLSDDMIQHNLGMWMEIRGQEGYYPLVNAGINWYMARHTCEFLLGDEKEVVIYSRTVREKKWNTPWLLASFRIDRDGQPDCGSTFPLPHRTDAGCGRRILDLVNCIRLPVKSGKQISAFPEKGRKGRNDGNVSVVSCESGETSVLYREY